MSNFLRAFQYLVKNEGGLYEDDKTGEISNFGISLKWLKTVRPEATADTIRNLTMNAATALYRQYWWNDNRMDLIGNSRIAIKLFDAMVNQGAATAIKRLQLVLNEPLSPVNHISQDGIIGVETADALAFELGTNPSAEDDILNSFVEELRIRYAEIARENPAHRKNLKNWMARAAKLPPTVPGKAAA